MTTIPEAEEQTPYEYLSDEHKCSVNIILMPIYVTTESSCLLLLTEWQYCSREAPQTGVIKGRPK